jgi:hypothetical protein
MDFPFIGHGIGMRPKHYGSLLMGPPPVDWLEVISENFMVPGGRPQTVLEKVRREVPVVLHGVSLSIGGSDPLDRDYLNALHELAARVEPAWVSDHLCWGTDPSGGGSPPPHRAKLAGAPPPTGGKRWAHELLPLPYTEEAVAHVVARVLLVQDLLRRRILLENVSSYVAYTSSTMTEWEFLSEIARRADCGILLDVNNIFVSAHNHGFDAMTYLRALPADRIGQIHLAGHSNKGTHLLDTHDHPVPEGVWALYREAVRRFGKVSTLVEWDDHIPELEVVVAESRKAAAIEKALTTHA